MSRLALPTLLKNPSVAAGVAWNPARTPMPGSVTLSSTNKVAALTSDGSSFFGTVALTNPIDFSAAVKKYIEFGVARAGGGFAGQGVASSASALNATLGYLGESAIQLCLWEDSSHDSDGTLSTPGNRPPWQTSTRNKWYLNGGGLWFGIVGVGWYNPATTLFNGTPDVTLAVITGFGAGVLFSMAASTVSNATHTVYDDAGSWLDTSPSGSTAFT